MNGAAGAVASALVKPNANADVNQDNHAAAPMDTSSAEKEELEIQKAELKATIETLKTMSSGIQFHKQKKKFGN